MATIKVNFQDEGQDLLFFIVDTEKLLVTDAGPFHRDIYKDSQIKSQIIEGRHITILTNTAYNKLNIQLLK